MEKAIDELMSNKDCELYNAFHEGHKAVLFNYWSLNDDMFNDTRKNNWPPSEQTIHGIFRRKEYWKTYSTDLPYRGAWTPPEPGGYQPAPRTKSNGDDESKSFVDALREVVVGINGGASGEAKSSIHLVRFSRTGKNREHVVNLFCDGQPLGPDCTIKNFIKAASQKNKKVFIMKPNHEMILFLKKEKKTIATFCDADLNTCIGSVIAIHGQSEIITFEFGLRPIIFDDESDDGYDILNFD